MDAGDHRDSQCVIMQVEGMSDRSFMIMVRAHVDSISSLLPCSLYNGCYTTKNSYSFCSNSQ